MQIFFYIAKIVIILSVIYKSNKITLKNNLIIDFPNIKVIQNIKI